MKNLRMITKKSVILGLIYASMYVNGEEINLYNFKYKNEEEYYDIKVRVLLNH